MQLYLQVFGLKGQQLLNVFRSCAIFDVTKAKVTKKAQYFTFEC